MVHLCNIKISAITIRYVTDGNYEIDTFINQLLESQKFDELVEKVADRAANKIKSREASLARQERLIEINKLNKSAVAGYRKATVFNNIKITSNDAEPKEGNIDIQAVLKDAATSQSENLRLKYKNLKKNAEVLNARAAKKVNDTETNNHSSKSDKSITEEENSSSVIEDNQDNSPHLDEKIKENIESVEPDKNTKMNVEEKPASFSFSVQEKNSSQKESNVEDNKVTLADNQGGAQHVEVPTRTTTTKKSVIRKEGNKLFTFVEAPEYAEYHEKMAKQKAKSSTDFI